MVETKRIGGTERLVELTVNSKAAMNDAVHNEFEDMYNKSIDRLMKEHKDLKIEKEELKSTIEVLTSDDEKKPTTPL